MLTEQLLHDYAIQADRGSREDEKWTLTAARTS